MPDNETTGTGKAVATDKVTYSGDADQNVQLLRAVHVTGAESSKTVVEITSADGHFVGGAIAHDSPDSGNPIKVGGKAKATAPADVSADADRVNAWFLLNGSQAFTLTCAGALIGGDATNGLDVDVTRLPALAAGTNNIGDVDVLTVPANPFGADADAASATGSISAKLRFIASTGIPITGTVTVGSHAVTNAGTFATQVDGSALTALQLIDDPVKADDAGFTVGTDKVMMSGLVAVAHGSNPDAADAADAVAPIANRHRVQFVIGGHPNVLTLKHTTITTAVTDAAIITVSSGTKIVVTRISFSLDNASTVFPTVLIGFGATNTPTTTGVLYSHGGYPAGGSNTIGDGSGILGIGADGDDLRITTTGNATGNGLQVTVSYYTIES